MDIKLDVNKLVDKLANAERTIGEQGKIIADMENTISNLLKEKYKFESSAYDHKQDIALLKKKCNELQSNSDFWYKKACELGYEYKPMTNPANEDNNDGA